MSFLGRRVLVTGAGKGIGRETARMRAGRGATVVALSRSPEDLASLQREIGCETIAVDLADTDAMTLGIRAALPIHLLVNNAAVALLDPVLKAPAARVRATFEVNMVAPLLITQIVAADLIARNLPGAIVNVSSLAAQVPAAAMSAYCAAKAGLSMLTQVAALELAPRGIRVNAVAPGFVHTPLTEPATQIPGVLDEYLENTPLGRAGTPEDIAEAVVFLSKASWLTGEVLDLNGGAHMKRYPDILGHVMMLATR
jgi:NAD(P)-dependent dehydrogenase (short-subunit alcohol dehydrogenase family)